MFFIVTALTAVALTGHYITISNQPAQPKMLTNAQAHDELVNHIDYNFPDMGAGVNMLAWLKNAIPHYEKTYGYDINEMLINYNVKDLFNNPRRMAIYKKAAENNDGTLSWYSCQDRNFEDKNILQMIAYLGDINSFKWLVETYDMNVNMLDCFGQSLAHYAAKEGHMSIVRYLISSTNFDIDLMNNRVRNIKNGMTVLDINSSEFELEHPTNAWNSRNINQDYLKEHGAKSGKEIMHYENCLSREFEGVNMFRYAAIAETRYAYAATDYSCKYALKQIEDRISKTSTEKAVKEKSLVLNELKRRGFDEFEWLMKRDSL